MACGEMSDRLGSMSAEELLGSEVGSIISGSESVSDSSSTRACDILAGGLVVEFLE